jgi:hypothetical protein
MAVTPITTSPIQYFTRVKSFSDASLSGLDNAINTFIEGTLEADTSNSYSVSVCCTGWNGTQYYATVSYTRFVQNAVSPDFSIPPPVAP